MKISEMKLLSTQVVFRVCIFYIWLLLKIHYIWEELLNSEKQGK